MSKLILMFVLTLFVLNESNALQRMETSTNNIREVTTGLKELIRSTTSRFDDLFGEVRESVENIEKKCNISELIDDFNQQTDELMDKDGSDVCKTVAREQTEVIQHLVTVLSCEFEINDQMRALKKQLKVLVSKMDELLFEINQNVIMCMRESYGNQINFDQCVDTKLVEIRQKVVAMRSEVEEASTGIKSSLPNFSDTILTCCKDKREKLAVKLQEIREKIKKCMLNNVSSNNSNSPNSNNVQELIEAMKNLIHETSLRFEKLFADIRREMQVMENEVNLTGHLSIFKQKIDEILAEDRSDSCEMVAYNQIQDVKNFSVISFCKFEIDRKFAVLRERLGVFKSKIGDLLKYLNQEASICMRQAQGNQAIFRECSEHKFMNVQQQFESLKKEVDETFNIVENSTSEFSDKISICIRNRQEQFMSRIHEAEDIVQNCVNGNNTTTSVIQKRNGFVNIAEYFKYLSDQISEAKVHVTQQLPEGVMFMEDKINKIVWTHNINDPTVEVKANVERILSQHWVNERLCGPTAHTNMNALARNAQIAVKGCIYQTKQVRNTLQDEFSLLADKCNMLDEKLNSRVLNCARQYLNNVSDFDHCLASEADGFRQQVAQMQQDISVTREDAVKNVQNVLNNLDACLTRVENRVTVQVKVLINNLNTCINHANVVFYR